MVNYYIYRVGQFIALSFPLKLAYIIAVFISDIHYFFAFKDRRIVFANIKAIFPEKSNQEIRRIRIRMYRNFAKYLVDFFRFQKLDSGYIEKNIRIENVKNFNDAMDKGKGVIVLTAHLGNWELGGVVLALLGYPFWAVALEHKHKKVNDFFNQQRGSKGIKVIPLSRAVRQCLSVLKNNEMVALVGDRDFSGKGIVLDFFNKPTFFPEGPAAFALKTGASIIPGFMVRNPDDTFTLRIEKALEIKNPGEDQEKNVRDIISTYKKIFEDYIRKYPDQWYIFRKFWIEG